MLIALTSQNAKTITKHASKTRRFLVYKVDEDKNKIEEVNKLDLPKENTLHEMDRSQTHPIYMMDVLIVGSCGRKFKERMKAFDVEVFQTELTDPMEALQQYLHH